MLKYFFIVLIVFCTSISNNAQNVDIKNVLKEIALTKNYDVDYTDFIITNHHLSKRSQIHHYYLNQRYQKIEVDQAVINFHVNRNGDLIFYHDQFVSDLSNKILTSRNILNHKEAFFKVCEALKYTIPTDFVILKQESNNDQKAIISAKSVVSNEVSMKLKYCQIEGDDRLKLCWDLTLQEYNGQNVWSVKADAEDGKILNKVNMVIHCGFGNHSEVGHEKIVKSEEPKYLFTPFNQYNVYPLGIESPNHGSRTIVTNPADPIASPYGWHDTDGQPGAEHTTTKGNNVEAKEDFAGNNGNGQMAQGGSDLVFNFPILPNVIPSVNKDAAITNLFYWNNVIHDIFYNYGFDEEAGNFQHNNYGNGGLDNDFVYADALDGSGYNNANFYTPNDGTHPRMQMFLWDMATQCLVNSPAAISGNYTFAQASFGATNYNVTNDIVLVNDGSVNPTLGCAPLVNAANLNGKIAMIDRGDCDYSTKCLYAQNAGAIAVIVCNNIEGAPVVMDPGLNGSQVTISCIMLSQEDCDTIKLYLNSPVNTTMSSGVLDSDYDNGIIMHEYGHGISNRLTGGGGNSACLFNQEQMGEGWSDWYGLMLTMDESDIEEEGRGIGTYVLNQPVNGQGLRIHRYSTDMTINPHTYDDIKSQAVPHGVGSVWAVMLWELTWAMIREYGFDSDLYYGTGGNNKALAIVTEALKLQPCSPGFVDGRNAILLADQVLYDGQHQCLIWKCFAKRGLGFSASQGSASDVFDGTEAFDMPRQCCLWVSNTNDTGNGSLRFAVGCANDGDTIRFLNFLHNQTIGITSTSIQINKNINLSHPYQDLINVKSTGMHSTMHIALEKAVEIQNLNIHAGIGNIGRAIINNGNLILQNTKIVDGENVTPNTSTILNNGILNIYGNSSILKE